MSKPRTICTASASILALSIAVLFLARAPMAAQTLARPGWVGSGLTAQPWFKHAILYEIDTRSFSDSNGDGIGDLKGITERLEYIHALGVDAILLRPLTPRQFGGQPGSQTAAIDPALGSLDDFDRLTLEASRIRVRVLLELPNPEAAVARFWLTQGVAGFYVPGSGSGGANEAAVQAIRKLLPTYVGQRVLIKNTDAAALTGTAKPASSSSNELILDRAALPPAPTAAVSRVRAALEHSQTLLRAGTPVFAIDSGTAADPHLGKMVAAVVLLNRSAALISAGQELGFSPGTGENALMPWGQPAAPVVEPEPEKPAPPVVAVPDKYEAYVPYVRPVAPKKPAPPDPATAAGQEINQGSLLNFYRELARLHHGNTALRDGEEITLNHDDRNALIWLRKPVSPTPLNPTILVACNLSDKPVVLSLKAEVAHLQLRGSFLKTMLRSDDLTGAPTLDPITLPAYGVYVGELRY